MFEVLYSRKKYLKKMCRGFNSLTKKLTHARKAIIKGKYVLKTIRTIKTPRFDGIQQTIEEILQLFNEEFTEESTKFMITNKENQYVLENLFVLFRQNGGNEQKSQGEYS